MSKFVRFGECGVVDACIKLTVPAWPSVSNFKRMILEARYSLKHNGLITKPFFYFN